MTVTDATATHRGFAPYFEHSSSARDYGEWVTCQECVQNFWTIDNLAADLKAIANWPGSDDGHNDVGLLLKSFQTITEIAKQDDTPERIARDLDGFLEARQNKTS